MSNPLTHMSIALDYSWLKARSVPSLPALRSPEHGAHVDGRIRVWMAAERHQHVPAGKVPVQIGQRRRKTGPRRTTVVFCGGKRPYKPDDGNPISTNKREGPGPGTRLGSWAG